MDDSQDTKEPTVYPAPTMDVQSARRMRLMLFGFLLPLVLAALIVDASTEPPPDAMVLGRLSDVVDGHLVEIRDARGAVILSGEFRSRVDSLGNTEKDAELTSPQGSTVIGEVELEIPAPGRGQRQPELEVDIIHLQPRARYSVAIDDIIVGTFLTDDRGSTDMELQEGEVLPGTPQPY